LVRCHARPVRCHQRSEEGNEAKKVEKLCLPAVMQKQLLFLVLAVLSAQPALAQEIYQWKDEKGPVALFGFSSIRGHGGENGDR
jgi:hypothetical protein